MVNKLKYGNFGYVRVSGQERNGRFAWRKPRPNMAVIEFQVFTLFIKIFDIHLCCLYFSFNKEFAIMCTKRKIHSHKTCTHYNLIITQSQSHSLCLLNSNCKREMSCCISFSRVLPHSLARSSVFFLVIFFLAVFMFTENLILLTNKPLVDC